MLSRAQFRIWPNWFRAMDVSLGWPLSREEFPEGVAQYFFGKTCVIGSGNMVKALFEGVVAEDPSMAKDTIVFGHSDPQKLRIFRKWGMMATLSSPSALPEIEGSRRWVLGCKPYQIEGVLKTLPIKPDDHVTSLAAGVTTDQILAWSPLKSIGISRVMPNTPASVQRGVAGVFDTIQSALNDCVAVRQWLTAAGGYVNVWKEDQMHAVTATSGSGSAYYFEAMHHMAAVFAEYSMRHPGACDAVFDLFNTAIEYAQSSGVDGILKGVDVTNNPIVNGVGVIMQAADQKSRLLAGEAEVDPASPEILAKQPSVLSSVALSEAALPPLSKVGKRALEDIIFSFMIGQYLSAQELGLSADQSWALVLKTAQGAVALAQSSAKDGVTLDVLADNVTSKDGTTDAARKTADAIGLWCAIDAYTTQHLSVDVALAP